MLEGTKSSGLISTQDNQFWEQIKSVELVYIDKLLSQSLGDGHFLESIRGEPRSDTDSLTESPTESPAQTNVVKDHDSFMQRMLKGLNKQPTEEKKEVGSKSYTAKNEASAFSDNQFWQVESTLVLDELMADYS